MPRGQSGPEETARRRLKGTLAWRFPGEKLLFITECRADRMPTRGEWALGLAGRAHCPGGACINEPTYRDRSAVLGITRARLVYQTTGPHGLLLKGVAIGVAALAVVLVAAGSVAGFLWGAALAAALLIGSRIAEAFGMGVGAIDFRRVKTVDRGSQTVEGVGHWGTMYRLRVPDVSDFRMIVAMAGAAGTAGTADAA